MLIISQEILDPSLLQAAFNPACSMACNWHRNAKYYTYTTDSYNDRRDILASPVGVLATASIVSRVTDERQLLSARPWQLRKT